MKPVLQFFTVATLLALIGAPAHAQEIKAGDLGAVVNVNSFIWKPGRTAGEYLRIPFEGKSFAANLRRSAAGRRPPVVVMCMGLDSAKEEMDSYESLFLARGMAVLGYDASADRQSWAALMALCDEVFGCQW